MANDGRIYITISDKQSGSEVGSSPNQKKASTTSNAKQRNDVEFNQAMHFIRNQATQFMGYAINNIGNFTGDFTSQRQVQQLYDLGTKVANIGVAFAVNPVAGALSLATTGINFAYQEYSNIMAIKKQNYQIDQLRAISGLNTLTNGSR